MLTLKRQKKAHILALEPSKSRMWALMNSSIHQFKDYLLYRPSEPLTLGRSGLDPKKAILTKEFDVIKD